MCSDDGVDDSTGRQADAADSAGRDDDDDDEETVTDPPSRLTV